MNSAINELVSKGASSEYWVVVLGLRELDFLLMRASDVLLVGHHYFFNQYLEPIESTCSKAGINLYFDSYIENLAARSYSGTLPVSQVIDPTEA